MKRTTIAAIATLAGAGTAMAGGLDRSGQNIDILFEQGNIVELSLGYAVPDVSGTDLPLGPFPGGRSSGDVGQNFWQAGLGYKQDLSDQLSFALILDQPYGVDVAYDTFAQGGSFNLGGTAATLDSSALTGLLRYRINDRVSVHGGLRAQQFNASVALGGAAYGGLNGYTAELDADTAVGYQVGAAYEIPEIALRLAVTYFSEIDHDVTVMERGAPSADIKVTTPKAVNVNFQTGIAPDTLLLASFRYADYGVTQVRPVFFAAASGGQSLTTIDKARDFSLGVGRRFSDAFSGAVSLNYSDRGPDDLVSPLSPVDGRYGITVSGVYNVNEQVRLTGGINYSRIGDARPETGTPDTARARFEDNDVFGVGLRIAYRF